MLSSRWPCRAEADTDLQEGILEGVVVARDGAEKVEGQGLDPGDRGRVSTMKPERKCPDKRRKRGPSRQGGNSVCSLLTPGPFRPPGKCTQMQNCVVTSVGSRTP